MEKIHKYSLSVLILFTVILSLLPVFHIVFTVGPNWRGIVPEYIEDSLYYYARINDVVKGHPFVGNPYFFEHKDSISPAFFFSDWLASAPIILGVPFLYSLVFNIVFWSVIFTTSLYWLFRSFGISRLMTIFFSIFTYVQVFWLFVRPVSMQVVFPAYALFIVSLFLWLKDQSRKNSIFLILSSVYCIYIYTYLLQIVFVTYVFLILYLLKSKQIKVFNELLKVLVLIFIFSIPFLLVTYFQISNPLYEETMFRIGLLSTHIPRMDFYYYCRWIFLTILLWYLSLRWLKSFNTNSNKELFRIFFITGSALVFVAGSNILTGKELELSNHVGRFIIWWFPLVIFTYFYVFYKNSISEFKNISNYKKFIIVFIIIVGFVAMTRNVSRAMPFFRNSSDYMISIQSYAGVIAWLNTNTTVESVILAPDVLSSYISIMTKDYVLFNPSGALQLVSDAELEDRYLVSRSIYGTVFYDQIVKDIGLYGGAGKILLAPKMTHHFDYMYSHYKKDIKPNIDIWVSLYNIKYVIFESGMGPNSDVLNKIKLKKLYSDNRFDVFEVVKKIK